MYTFTADGTMVIDNCSLPRALWRLGAAAWRALRALWSVVWVELLCLLDQWAHAGMQHDADTDPY